MIINATSSAVRTLSDLPNDQLLDEIRAGKRGLRQMHCRKYLALPVFTFLGSTAAVGVATWHLLPGGLFVDGWPAETPIWFQPLSLVFVLSIGWLLFHVLRINSQIKIIESRNRALMEEHSRRIW